MKGCCVSCPLCLTDSAAQQMIGAEIRQTGSQALLPPKHREPGFRTVSTASTTSTRSTPSRLTASTMEATRSSAVVAVCTTATPSCARMPAKRRRRSCGSQATSGATLWRHSTTVSAASRPRGSPRECQRCSSRSEHSTPCNENAGRVGREAAVASSSQGSSVFCRIPGGILAGGGMRTMPRIRKFCMQARLKQVCRHARV